MAAAAVVVVHWKVRLPAQATAEGPSLIDLPGVGRIKAQIGLLLVLVCVGAFGKVGYFSKEEVCHPQSGRPAAEGEGDGGIGIGVRDHPPHLPLPAEAPLMVP